MFSNDPNNITVYKPYLCTLCPETISTLEICLEIRSRIPDRPHTSTKACITILSYRAVKSCLKVSPHLGKTVHCCFDNLQLQHFEWLQAVTALVVLLISDMAWWHLGCVCVWQAYLKAVGLQGAISAMILVLTHHTSFVIKNNHDKHNIAIILACQISVQPCLSTALDRQTAVCPRHKMSLSSFYSVLLRYPLSPWVSSAVYTEHRAGLCRFKMQSGWEQKPLFSSTGWSELQECSPSPCLREGGASWGSWGGTRVPSAGSALWICIQGMGLISVWL